MRDRTRVLIIGGGIAGPALALFLRKAGIPCALYEAYPYVEHVGGGLGLAPNGMRVLESLGLAGELQHRSTRIANYSFRNDRGTELARTRVGDAGPPMLALSRSLLFSTLARALREHGVETHYDKRLEAVEERPGGVVARFVDGSAAEGNVLIGADGVRSTVRKHLLPDARAAYTGMIGIGGFTTIAAAPEMPRDTMTFVFGRHGFFGYSAADAGMALWWTNLFRDRELAREALEHTRAETLKAELAERFGAYHAPIPALIAGADTVLQLNVYDMPSLPTWHRGRIALIGDAAHAVSPNAGQGAALALEDAMYLAKLLRDCPYEHALARYERDRKARAEKVVAEGRRRGADKALVGPFAQALRELAISVFVRLSGAHADRWLHDYEIAW